MSDIESSALKRLKQIQQRILESTPALQDAKKKPRLSDQMRESRPTTSNSFKKKRDVSHLPAVISELLSKIDDLRRRINSEVETIEQKERDMKAREDRYIRREQEYRKILTDYESELRARTSFSKAPVDDQCSRNLVKISKLHTEVNSNIGNIQKKTSQILTEQEKDVQRQFESRLKDITRELDEERKKKLEGVGSFAENESKLIRELELMSSAMALIESKNESLKVENKQIKLEFKEKEAERETLMKEIVFYKRENAQLEEEIERTKPNDQSSRPNTSSDRLRAASTNALNSKPERVEAVINRLKHMVEAERKHLRTVRTAYAKELQGKTELEQILKQCTDEVRSQNLKKRGKDTAFTPQDREKIIEMMLSQDKVLALLYEKTFPARAVTSQLMFDNLNID